jgi:hypothetical protein
MSAAPATADRRLARIADLSPALSGAAMALELALAGVGALDDDDALPVHHAEDLQYLARHVAELVEGVAATARDRPPRWGVGATFQGVPQAEAPLDG